MKDTITPLNYTKEAIKDLSFMEKGLRSNAPLTSYIMRKVIDMLDSSVKFILPNCCDIIEPEEYRQTHFDLARLPYPVVTFEIPWFKDNVETKLQRLLGKKPMVLTIFATLILIDVGLPKSIRRHYEHGCPRLDEFRT